MNIYFKVLENKNLSRLVNEMTPSVFDKLNKKRTIVVCDKPAEHYIRCPLDLFDIGSASWEKRENNFDEYPYDTPREYISTVNISRINQNQGLGQQLIKFTLQDIAEQGIRIASIHTDFDNRRMQHIVEKLGFKEKNSYFTNHHLYYEKEF